jgi:hypothetical protein
MNYPSVKQGCVQVLSIRILLQTPFTSPISCCYRQRFVLVLVPHLFFGSAVLAEQVATREHPAYLISCCRLSRIVSTGRVDSLGVSASEDACAYSCHLAVPYHVRVLQQWIRDT